MVKLRHVAWNKPSTVVSLSLIIFLLHSHGIDAACHPPVGHAVTGEGVICKRLSLGTKLKTSCSGVVHKNGILLNDTQASNVFGITSVADYGSYRCSSDRDGVVTYIVLPDSCNACADKFVTVDIKPYNLTYINVTCVVHIAGMPYCCSLYQNQTISESHGIILQGLSKMPVHLTIYRCLCSLKCHDVNLQLPLVADVESNYTTFDPASIINDYKWFKSKEVTVEVLKKIKLQEQITLEPYE